MGKDTYRVLRGRPEGKRPQGRSRRGLEDIIKMDLKEIGSEVVYWIGLVLGKHKGWAVVNTAMNLHIP
jgi:hypothetical protein